MELKKINGPRVAVFEVDGFDTHAAQGATDGAHADCLNDYDKIVKGLNQSMSKEAFDNTLIVTLTEFGRTIKQNSSNIFITEDKNNYIRNLANKLKFF